jgi:hypothetical protein
MTDRRRAVGTASLDRATRRRRAVSPTQRSPDTTTVRAVGDSANLSRVLADCIKRIAAAIDAKPEDTGVTCANA